jgi:hypothetical protein
MDLGSKINSLIPRCLLEPDDLLLPTLSSGNEFSEITGGRWTPKQLVLDFHTWTMSMQHYRGCLLEGQNRFLLQRCRKLLEGQSGKTMDLKVWICAAHWTVEVGDTIIPDAMISLKV